VENIPPQTARRIHGITTRHERMPSGELRFRLMGDDGNGYIRTVAGPGGWQNSHLHRRTTETYVVESGWMVMAIADAAGEPKLHHFGPGMVTTAPIDLAHNVYLPAGAVVHTVKHGCVAGEPDWEAAPALDAALAKIDPRTLEPGSLAN
jgi:mannose-6-phosphate isomerase-like protein (cupin superfamily)